MGSMTTHIECPHCSGHITICLAVSEGPDSLGGYGPPAYDPGIEIDTFVLEAIEKYRTSFSTLAALLEEREVLTGKGGKRWYPASARRLYEHALTRRQKRDKSETSKQGE